MRCLFHCFGVLGREPPCLVAVSLGSISIGGALDVSRTMVEMLKIRESSEVHAICCCSIFN